MDHYRVLFDPTEHYQDIHPKLMVCVYACDKLDKYKQQILKIQGTWGRTAREHQIPVLFFLGEQRTDLVGEEYVNIPGVADDYESASYKQFLGLHHIAQHYQPEFVLCCGTDTYPNLPKMVQWLEQFDPNESLYLGGHGCKRQFGDRILPFHSGGPGFILSRTAMERCKPDFASLMPDWKEYCRQTGKEDLIPACDVAIAHFVVLPHVDAKVVSHNEGFFHCNYKGMPCHPNQPQVQHILSCHLMSLQDFDTFTRLLEDHSHFVAK